MLRRIAIGAIFVVFIVAASIGAAAGRLPTLARGIPPRLMWFGFTLLCGITAVFALGWMLFAGMSDPRGKRAWSLAEGFDQVGNAAFGGSEDMTLSAHAGYRLRDPDPPTWARWLCAGLNMIDPGHCEKSRKAFEEGLKFPAGLQRGTMENNNPI
jgi:hypothetical protein